jgi:thiosulfate dehydrogenase [quinone] large subunit
MASITQSPSAQVDVRRLRRVPLLADLSEENLAPVAAAAQLKHFEDGALLMRQGDVADALYIIQAGSADVIVCSRDGHERVIGTLGEGEPAGELGLMTGDSRTATVQASGPIDAIVVPRDAFTAAMQHRGVAHSIATELAQRLAARTRAHALQNPPLSRLLFGNPRLAPLWLVLRVWLAYQWLSAGISKLTDPAWMSTGAPLQGYWTASLTTAPRPVIAYDWYRAFIEGLLAGGHYVWFAKVVAFGEVGVGIGLILGALTGVAAGIGLLMNFNYLLAGSASTNPVLAAVALLIVLAWKVAGRWGVDRWLLPRLVPALLKDQRRSWLGVLRAELIAHGSARLDEDDSGEFDEDVRSHR